MSLRSELNNGTSLRDYLAGTSVPFDDNPAQYMIGPQTAEWTPPKVEQPATYQKVDTNNNLLGGVDTDEEEDYEPETATDAVNAAVAAGAEEKKAEVQQAKAAQQQLTALQQLQNALGGNMLSSDDVYNRDYQRYRSMGYSDRKARKWAAQNAGQYRLQRISGLNDAFLTQGVNPDGSINEIGASIIGMMGREDGQQASMMNAMRPGLKDVWGIAQQRMAAEDAFQRQIALKQMDYDMREALQNARIEARYGGGSGGRSSGGEGGSSGGGRSSGGRSTSTDSNMVKSAKEYIKHWREVHKDDGDEDWKNNARYQQALRVVDSNADNLFPDYDLDTDTGFISAITALKEGRNPNGTFYSTEAIDRLIDDQVDDSTEEGAAFKQYLKNYNHNYGG